MIRKNFDIRLQMLLNPRTQGL